MSNAAVPRVYLVGAGPGDPGLLTLRAVECLARADLVLYDKLVPSRLLDFAAPSAERRCVGEFPGNHSQRWPLILQAVLDAAQQGKTVVRLKGGDPFIFGRAAEEGDALRAAGVSYEIVPGITAAVAAAACAEIPLTHRQLASAVAFVTGHEDPTKPHAAIDWQTLARFPGTLAVYMGLTRLDLIARALIEHGKPPETPAAAVASASTGQQENIRSTLAKLPEAVRSAGVAAPAIILIGPAVGLAPTSPWFESRPLSGKRVLVTRPRHQAADFVRRLEQLGAIPYVLPTVDIRPLDDWSVVDDCLARLSEFHWLVFTSANGVQAFIGRLRQVGRDMRALAGVRLAAIGPGTAEALRAYHLDADLVPDEYRSERLAAALSERAAGQRILIARADRGRDVLHQELAKVATVEQLTVYCQVDAVPTDAAIQVALRCGEIDFVTLTSANIARSFLRSLDEASRTRIASGDVQLVTISPVTSAAVTEFGCAVAAEARTYTTNGLITALVELAQVGEQRAH